ncbi:MAG: LysR family transcriptional regulator [Halioglobus sp.]|nr:LysR family transcriptional regulator [Halioglobus sp.]
MRINNVDLNLFIAFEVIYREKNLTRAAEVLNISQPAVSNTLRRMRESFNDPLFVRSPHGMQPTPVADSLIGEVREALRRLNNTLVSRESFDPEKARRTFHVRMHDLTAALLLPALMERIHRCAPNIVVRASTAGADVVQMLSKAELDLSIEPPTLVDPLLYYQPVLQEPYVCAMRKGHPLAQKKLTIKRYLELFHIDVSNTRDTASEVDMALHAQGVKRRIRSQLDSYLVAPDIVARTDLVATIPQMLAARYDLVIKPLPFDLPLLRLQLYWHKSVEVDPPNSWLRSQVLSLVNEMEPGSALYP